MSYEETRGFGLDYRYCTYEGARFRFRGPKCRMQEPYIAYLGGTKTFGRFVARPFCDRVAGELEVGALNLGVANAGVDAFLHDPGTLLLTDRAEVTVLQVTSAHLMSNRFYTVHPRRNDRFLQASERLRRLYPEIDFTEFHFVNHMLVELAKFQSERFLLIMEELEKAWLSRMRQLTERIGSHVVLLWFADHAPEEKRGLDHFGSTPFGVNAKMMKSIGEHVAQTVIVNVSSASLLLGSEGMICHPRDVQKCVGMLGPSAHEEAANALVKALGPWTSRDRTPASHA